MVLLSAKGTGKDMRFFLFLPALADMRALYRSDRSTQEETQCGDAHAANQLPLRKRYSFFEFSICLSRACLGKIIVFILKVAQKTPSFYRQRPRRAFRWCWSWRSAPCTCQKTPPFVLNFLYHRVYRLGKCWFYTTQAPQKTFFAPVAELSHRVVDSKLHHQRVDSIRRVLHRSVCQVGVVDPPEKAVRFWGFPMFVPSLSW